RLASGKFTSGESIPHFIFGALRFSFVDFGVVPDSPNLGIFSLPEGPLMSRSGAFRSTFGFFNVGPLTLPEGILKFTSGALRSSLGPLRSGRFRSGGRIPPLNLGAERSKPGVFTSKSGTLTFGPEKPEPGILNVGILNFPDGLPISAFGIFRSALGPLRFIEGASMSKFGADKFRSGPSRSPSMSTSGLFMPNLGIFILGILNFPVGESMSISGVFTSNLGALRAMSGKSMSGASIPPFNFGDFTPALMSRPCPFGNVPKRLNLGIFSLSECPSIYRSGAFRSTFGLFNVGTLTLPEGISMSKSGALKFSLGPLRSTSGRSKSGGLIPPLNLGAERSKSGVFTSKSGP
ncbi:hypothetical protein J4Q44_G00285390, partial [Coregonus suidteri]